MKDELVVKEGEGVIGEDVEAVKEIILAVHSQLFFLSIIHGS